MFLYYLKFGKTLGHIFATEKCNAVCGYNHSDCCFGSVCDIYSRTRSTNSNDYADYDNHTNPNDYIN